MQQPINVLFPVETAIREFDYRLFLACMHAHDGNKIFIGQHDVLYDVATRMRGGIYVGKHIFRSYFPTDISRYQRLKGNEFALIDLHEEGAIYPGTPEHWRYYLDIQLDPTVLAADDHICTWGEFQRDHYLQKNPPRPENVHATGHPRFDLYKPPYRQFYEPQAELLRERFGPFVLVNTNMTTANYGLGRREGFRTHAGWPANSAADRLDFIEYWAHNLGVLANFVKLVYRLSLEFPDLTIILRPHPTEDPNFYRDAFVNLPNVKVIFDGAVPPWILASCAMIHDGCTTGVEACLLGVPAINFKPHEDPAHDLFLPNQLGIRCTTEDEVADTVEQIIAKKPGIENRGADATIRRLMQNFSGDTFENLLRVMRRAEENLHGERSAPSAKQIRARERWRQIDMGTRGLARHFFPEKQRQHEHYKLYFPPLSKTGVREKLDRIQRILDCEVNAEFFGPQLMAITRARTPTATIGRVIPARQKTASA